MGFFLKFCLKSQLWSFFRQKTNGNILRTIKKKTLHFVKIVVLVRWVFLKFSLITRIFIDKKHIEKLRVPGGKHVTFCKHCRSGTGVLPETLS